MEQPKAKTGSYNYDAPSCKICGYELKNAETSKRSGNCNRCYHGSGDTTQAPSSSSTGPTTTGSSRGGGNGGNNVTPTCKSCDNELSEEDYKKHGSKCTQCAEYTKLGGYRGEEEDSYRHGASHKRGNTAPWRGQTSSR